jgi:hypothetical protein
VRHVGLGYGLFPLTPTLSLGEREKPRQSVGEKEIIGTSETRAWRFPLPKGEGQGEGKGNVRTASGSRIRFDVRPTRAGP